VFVRWACGRSRGVCALSMRPVARCLCAEHAAGREVFVHWACGRSRGGGGGL